MKNFVIYSGIFFTALFLWLAFRHTNIDNIQQAFKDARLWPMVATLICLFFFYWIKAIRWRLILSPSYKLNTSDLAPAMMAGAAGNNLLPAHMGELIRTFFLGNQLGIPKSTVFATLVVERLFDIVTVLMLLSFAFLLSELNEQVYKAGGFLLCCTIVIVVVAYLLTTRSETWVNFIHQRLTFLTSKTRNKFAEQITHLATGLKSVQSPHLYFPVLLCSLVTWLLMALCIYLSIVAFSITISPLHAFIILGLSVAGLMLPTSPGFFGTIEYCFVLGLTTANVDPNIAVSAAIYYHVPIWITVTLVGLLSIKTAGYSFKQLKSEK